MERQRNDLSNGPLPGGDRRGTSGAGAGRLSMRTVSGSSLNRRARVGEPENTTAEHNSHTENTLMSGTVSQSLSGTSELTATTTSLEHFSDDARRKWSPEEQKELLYCYFKAKLEGPGYIKRMYDLFSTRNTNNPKVHRLDSNKLSNQARLIISRKLLSEQEIEHIKLIAQQDTNLQSTPLTDLMREPSTSNHAPQNTNTDTTGTPRSYTPDSHTQPTEYLPNRPLTRSLSRQSHVSLEEENSSNTENTDLRRKWTFEEQCELMFCYFKAKAGGPGYIKRLYNIFVERNPNNPKTRKFDGNTLSNQARTIMSRKLISDETLSEIKTRAEQLILEQIEEEAEETYTNTPNNNTEITSTHLHANQSPNTIDNSTEPLSTNREHQNTNEEQTIDLNVNENLDPLILELLQNIAETKEIPVDNRKCLPKPNFTKQFFGNLAKINKFLPTILETNRSLRNTNDIIYAAAKTLVQANGQTPYTPTKVIKPKQDPPWKIRLKNRIEDLRKELGRLTEIKKGVNSKKMHKIKNTLYNKYKIFNEQDHDRVSETLKQRIKALAGRLKRYDDMNKRKMQNQLFQENQHQFYRSLNSSSNIQTKEIPSKTEIQTFWESILSEPVPFNKEAQWIKETEEAMENIEIKEFNEIGLEQIKAAIKKLSNWKTPGIDKIQNFYLKYLTSTHIFLAELFTKIINKKEQMDEWFTTGLVILIPKKSDTKNPKNWRPIACLPTMYKLLTSVIANELYLHCDTNNILSPEQRGCRRNVRGCKDHLMINKAILEDAHQSQKNLSMAWVDYQKAFDSISHEWLLKVLDVYKCPTAIKDFLEIVIPNWNVIMTAKGSCESVTTDPIYIRRGIFQGDSLSPLLFCLAINPLSQIMNKYKDKGYRLKDKTLINHLIYMDDLKIYSNNKNNLKTMIDSTEIFTRDIGMSFGLDKCNVLHLKAGRRDEHQGQGHILLSGEQFEHLKTGESYKYLGVQETGKINHNEIRQQIQKEYFRRIKCITNSHLNSRNLMRAINSYAVPVLLYSFGIINYKASDLKSIDTKTRKLLSINKSHHQKADVERLYLPIEEGGRGLLNIETMYKTQIIKYETYLEAGNDHLIQTIGEHDKAKDKYSIEKESMEFRKELGLQRDEQYTDKEIKTAVIKNRINKLKAKPLHGQFYKAVLEKDNIDKEASFRWLKKQPVSPILEASIYSLQDQAVVTRQHERDVLKKPVDGKCRICGSKDETAQHIVAGCEKLAGTYYTKRHNNIVQYVHWTLLKKHGFECENLWWKEHLLQPQIKENDTAKIMWEIPVQTDITVTHNRPDIIYINKTENKTYLIDITIPSDYNIGAKEVEKLSKYHLLQKEITRLWHMPTSVIPIVIGTTGTVAKSLRRYCDFLDSKINTHIIQKQAAIHTSIILSKVLGNTIFVDRNPDSPSP